MSKADELAAKLKQTRHTHADAALEIDCWPAQVYDLYHRIEAWLQPVTEVGLKSAATRPTFAKAHLMAKATIMRSTNW